MAKYLFVVQLKIVKFTGKRIFIWAGSFFWRVLTNWCTYVCLWIHMCMDWWSIIYNSIITSVKPYWIEMKCLLNKIIWCAVCVCVHAWQKLVYFVKMLDWFLLIQTQRWRAVFFLSRLLHVRTPWHRIIQVEQSHHNRANTI